MTVIAANAGRYPVSAQCRMLGVPRSTYYWMLAHPERERPRDPISDDVARAFEEGFREYGAPKIKRVLERRGIVASRRRITRIMHENGLVSAYSRKKYRSPGSKPNEAPLPNLLDRRFDGHAPRTHVASDLTYVRTGRKWSYVCLLVDLHNREIVGHSVGDRRDSDLVKAAFATVRFPLSDIEVFHTDRGSEFANASMDEMLEAFGIERSLSRKGCPYDNAVVESANNSLKRGLVHRETFSDTEGLRRRVNEWVWFYNNRRVHSTLGYMTPVEFREAGLTLPKSSK